MCKHGVDAAIHYLDDYLMVGDPHSRECAQALQYTLALCEQLGVPVSKAKVEGPSTVLTFLGILLDTIKLELRLPQEKLTRLNQMIREWSQRKLCTKRQLLSLIGHLQHACKVVRPGRTFLRRMIELASVAKELHHHIRLTASFRSDLQWWATFLSRWNGVGMMAANVQSRPGAVVTSDA